MKLINLNTKLVIVFVSNILIVVYKCFKLPSFYPKSSAFVENKKNVSKIYTKNVKNAFFWKVKKNVCKRLLQLWFCSVVPSLFYTADNLVQDAAVAKAIAYTAGHFEPPADDRLIKSTPYLDLALKPYDDVTLASQMLGNVECALSRVVTMIVHALMQSTSHNTSVRSSSTYHHSRNASQQRLFRFRFLLNEHKYLFYAAWWIFKSGVHFSRNRNQKTCYDDAFRECW